MTICSSILCGNIIQSEVCVGKEDIIRPRQLNKADIILEINLKFYSLIFGYDQ